METLEAQRAELEARINRLKRHQRIHYAYTLAVLLLGVGIGYVLAQWIIDPITVIPGCGGIRT